MFCDLDLQPVRYCTCSRWKWVQRKSGSLNSNLSRSLTEDTHHQHFQVSPVCWIFDETENYRRERSLSDGALHPSHWSQNMGLHVCLLVIAKYTFKKDVHVNRAAEQCFQAKMLSHHFVTKSWKSEVKTPCGSLGGGWNTEESWMNINSREEHFLDFARVTVNTVLVVLWILTSFTM